MFPQLEEYFYFSRKIPDNVKLSLKDFLIKDAV
jgi:hypothetical protein